MTLMSATQTWLKDFENLAELQTKLVIAIYEDKWWIGKVIEISQENNDAKVHFMASLGPASKFSCGDAHEKCFVHTQCNLDIVPSECCCRWVLVKGHLELNTSCKMK